MRSPQIDGHTKLMVRASQHDSANVKHAAGELLSARRDQRMVDGFLVIAYGADIIIVAKVEFFLSDGGLNK
jgi:hypothetical protein